MMTQNVLDDQAPLDSLIFSLDACPFYSKHCGIPAVVNISNPPNTNILSSCFLPCSSPGCYKACSAHYSDLCSKVTSSSERQSLTTLFKAALNTLTHVCSLSPPTPYLFCFFLIQNIFCSQIFYFIFVVVFVRLYQ